MIEGIIQTAKGWRFSMDSPWYLVELISIILVAMVVLGGIDAFLDWINRRIRGIR